MFMFAGMSVCAYFTASRRSDVCACIDVHACIIAGMSVCPYARIYTDVYVYA